MKPKNREKSDVQVAPDAEGGELLPTRKTK